MKRIVFSVIIVILIAAGGGLLWVSSGLVSVAASSGHWALTEWFLHYTMRRAVQTQALAIEVPALDDPAMLVQGAGHYAGGCVDCHGAPGEPRSPLVEQMVPQPPELGPVIAKWRPNELFWIVKHGIKYTGMPGWVAPQRSDEIWAVVVFLQKLPGLDAQSYRQLAYGETEATASAASATGARAGELRLGSVDKQDGDAVLRDCARCHGHDGRGRGPGAFPNLSRLSDDYLYAALRSYAEGERASGIMQPLAAGLGEPELRRLAQHYAEQNAVAGTAPPVAGTAAVARGEIIATQGIPERNVPACRHCHGPQAVVNNPFFPPLAGQPADYLTTQLELWAAGERGGSVYAHVMEAVARELKPEQIRDVADYFAALSYSQPRQ